MIRVGIAGTAGELTANLIQLLVNHPDVELAWVVDPDYMQADVSDIYRELIGDTYLHVTDTPDF